MRPEMRYRLQILRKLRKGYAPTWRFIPKLGQISVKFSVLGSYTLIVALIGVKFGAEDPHRCNVSPLRSKKLKIGI